MQGLYSLLKTAYQLLQELFEKECQMALQDRVQEETSERKNALEAYIYSLRNKLADSLATYVTESEAESVRQKLDTAEVLFDLEDNHSIPTFISMPKVSRNLPITMESLSERESCQLLSF